MPNKCDSVFCEFTLIVHSFMKSLQHCSYAAVVLCLVGAMDQDIIHVTDDSIKACEDACHCALEDLGS